MDTHVSPNITSFVIRFVQSESASGDTETGSLSYRGTIRHIQSDEEISFTRWADAMQFIRQFIKLELEEG